jgi:CHAT domain-containing protein
MQDSLNAKQHRPALRAEALHQAMLSLIDGLGMVDHATQKPVYFRAHPLFWAPSSLVGYGGAGTG